VAGADRRVIRPLTLPGNPTESELIFRAVRFAGGNYRNRRRNALEQLTKEGVAPGKSWVHPRPLIKSFRDLRLVRSVHLAVEEYRRPAQYRTLLSLAQLDRASKEAKVYPVATFLPDDTTRFPRISEDELARVRAEQLPTNRAGTISQEGLDEKVRQIVAAKFRINCPFLSGGKSVHHETLDIFRVEGRSEGRTETEKYWVMAPYTGTHDGNVVKASFTGRDRD